MADLFVLLIVIIGILAAFVGYLIGYFVLSALQGPVCRLWRAFVPYEWQVWYQQRYLQNKYVQQMHARVLHFQNTPNNDVVSSSKGKRVTHVRPNVFNKLLEEGMIRIGFPQHEHQQPLIDPTLFNHSTPYVPEQREWIEHKSDSVDSSDDDEKDEASDDDGSSSSSSSGSGSIRVCIREDDPEQPVATIRIRYATRPHNRPFARSITV